MQAVDLQDKLCLRRIWGRWVGGTRLLFSARHQPPTRLSALGACGEGVFSGGRLSLQRFSACTSVYTHGHTCAHTQMQGTRRRPPWPGHSCLNSPSLPCIEVDLTTLIRDEEAKA